MRCVVFGGTGYIGSHLVQKLNAAGHDITILSRTESSTSSPSVHFIKGSLSDSPSVERALQGADVVYHLAWEGIPGSSSQSYVAEQDSNVRHTVSLLEQCVALGVRRVVFCSSGGAIYGPAESLPITETHPLRPITSYGLAKLAVEAHFEQFRLNYGLDFIIARPGNAFGASQRTDGLQGVLGRLIWCLRHQQPFAFYSEGTTVRDFVHVEDVAEALHALGGYCGRERIFNVGSGLGTSVAQLLELVEAASGKRVLRDYQPGRWFDVPVNILSNLRLRQETGWLARHDLGQEIGRLCIS